ncbi:VDE lipocalin diadinoxanthin de-epoxidase domain containing protein [Nitzschia inconspicua]|uniref:VDE lipocalin diadinoxanthin de-epoxidase domain containing protein n=1 Tax=Nitzschia inconspicua TaxID=303405 RepID=A0A9K3LSD2_9STRA|nr:VDE lipocalin diadinoxanthin de-epoxidase domain containing protein [Nitzschia inconspicua]
MKRILSVASVATCLLMKTWGFVLPSITPSFVSVDPVIVTSRQPRRHPVRQENHLYLFSSSNGDCDPTTGSPWPAFLRTLKQSTAASAMAVALCCATLTAPLPSQAATDPGAIVGCLFSKCQLPLLKCISNPKCLANVVCINTCNGKEDEIGCQIQCGDLFENEVVGEFNKCVVSDMGCVPQKPDDGQYPVPDPSLLVPKFDTKLWNGKWYITAGQNPLFDIFPCQVHFFTETSPGTFYGKLNWRIEEPDGEFFTRDALQEFVQDPKEPAHLLNHDNEYLHYQDDWYIVDFEYDDNPTNTPPFAFVYYRGSNDAWDGYGGVVVYTRDSKLPESLRPRLQAAAKKVGYDFDKDFTITDNTCKSLDKGEAVVLREKFAGKVLLQTENLVQSQATKLRGNAANSVKAQKIFFSDESKQVQEAFEKLGKDIKSFEEEVISK